MRGYFYIAKVYSYNRNTHLISKVLRFISAKLFHQDNFDGLQYRRISYIKSPDSGKTGSGVMIMTGFFLDANRTGPYFEGWYLKHQTQKGQTLAMIPAFHIDI